METPKNNEGIGKLNTRIKYHRAALKADERFPELLHKANDVLLKAEALLQRDKDIDNTRLDQIASREVRDRRLKNSLRDLEVDALALVKRNRKDERYQNLFGPKNLSEINRLTPDARQTDAKVLADILDKTSLESLRTHQAPIRQHAQGIESNLNALLSADKQQDLLARDVAAFRVELTKFFQLQRAELLSRLPHDEETVDGFFFRSSYLNSKK